MSLVSSRAQCGKILNMELATWLGLLIGFGGIILGNLIEGGHMGSLLQFTAGLIVLMGTVGAVMVSHPMSHIQQGLRLARRAFFDRGTSGGLAFEDETIQSVTKDLVECTKIYKKDSLQALESRIQKIQDPFLKKIMRSVVDGLDPAIVRNIFETEIDVEEENLLAYAKIWSDAGGFCPTIGIIGAVLGLIHVMGNLSDTSKLGAGIAVAFVATVYGVGFANLLFIPLNSKIKKQIHSQMRVRRMTLEGALLVNSGLSSTVVDQKVRAYYEA
jgi:chemotaxis protein MotA